MTGWKKMPKTYGGTEANKSREKEYGFGPNGIHYNRFNTKTKKGLPMLSLIKASIGLGVVLILLAFMSVALSFHLVASIFGVMGCLLCIAGLLPILWVSIWLFFRQKG